MPFSWMRTPFIACLKNLLFHTIDTACVVCLLEKWKSDTLKLSISRSREWKLFQKEGVTVKNGGSNKPKC